MEGLEGALDQAALLGLDSIVREVELDVRVPTARGREQLGAHILHSVVAQVEAPEGGQVGERVRLDAAHAIPRQAEHGQSGQVAEGARLDAAQLVPAQVDALKTAEAPEELTVDALQAVLAQVDVAQLPQVREDVPVQVLDPVGAQAELVQVAHVEERIGVEAAYAIVAQVDRFDRGEVLLVVALGEDVLAQLAQIAVGDLHRLELREVLERLGLDLLEVGLVQGDRRRLGVVRGLQVAPRECIVLAALLLDAALRSLHFAFQKQISFKYFLFVISLFLSRSLLKCSHKLYSFLSTAHFSLSLCLFLSLFTFYFYL